MLFTLKFYMEFATDYRCANGVPLPYCVTILCMAAW